VKPLSFLPLTLMLALAACASHGGATPPSGSSAQSLRQACDERGAWTRASSSDCALCVSSVPVPTCGCPVVTGSSAADVVGKCLAQAQAKGAETDCNGIDKCVDGCQGDCGCADACYAGHDRCRDVAAPLDQCIAQTCDSRCR
jgi:hypothetical protein